MGFFGKLLLGFLIVVIVLGIIGLVLKRRDAKKGEDVLPEKTLENVADVNDQFNRARYMDKEEAEK